MAAGWPCYKTAVRRAGSRERTGTFWWNWSAEAEMTAYRKAIIEKRKARLKVAEKKE